MPDIAAGNMGNSILNLIYGQQNDPAQQMSDLADTLQARNRVAIGTDLQGNLLPAPPPGTPPGVGSGQITGPPQDPTAAMQQIQQNGMLTPGQTPNAYKSEPSMGSLVIALQRQQEAAAGLQQSIGLGMSAFARPENRERVFKSFAPQAPVDPTKLGDSIMNMTMQTQGQDRMNALGQMIMDPQRGPGIASQLNIGWDELKARFQADPGGTGQMIQSFLTPTDQLKNLQGIGRMQGGGAGAGGGANPTLNDVSSGIITGVAGATAQPMISAQQAWRNDPKNAGKPDSAMPWKAGNLQSFNQYTANEQQKETDRGQASAILGSADNTMRELQGHIENLQYNPGLMSILNGSQAIKTAAREAMNNPDGGWANAARIGGVLTEPQIAAIDELRQINSGNYAAALSSLRGITSRPAAVEAQGVADAMGQTKAVDMSGNQYIKQAIEPLLVKIKRSRAAAWGATGNVNNMDQDLAPYMHPNYLQGGDQYKEGSGVENFKINQPLSDTARQAAINQIKADYTEKERVIDSYRSQGYDVSDLEKLTPDKLRKM